MAAPVTDQRRALPSVDRVLTLVSDLSAEFGPALVTEIAREVLTEARTALASAPADPVPDPAALVTVITERVQALARPSLRPVINASGVILHTNLGRAPLSSAAQAAQTAAAGRYTTLEYDLAGGGRGSRTSHLDGLLTRLTGAAAGLAVNNAAGALLLVLSALARGKGVAVSRGQLVEIGGGFRVPDVLRQSGARLIEVGTTNRTHLGDYQDALGPKTALILRCHASNFRQIGFTAEVDLKALCGLGPPVVDDLGSGALLDTADYGLAHEPTVQESLAAGASLVVFSGDKLLGGPQAGLIVGRADLLARVKKHPLARALRADKTTIAGLEATLLHYLKGEAEREIPIWRMLATSTDDLLARARHWRGALDRGEVVAGQSTIGGGSLPGETLPTWLLALPDRRPNALATRLRTAATPVIVRVQDERVLLDPRTVMADEETALINTVLEHVGGASG
jgi:L-seryl-tRNA(Ser) seleniumtransferase